MQAKAHRPALLWHEHLMGFAKVEESSAALLRALPQDLLWHSPNATTMPAAQRPKNYLAYVDVPRTGGRISSALYCRLDAQTSKCLKTKIIRERDCQNADARNVRGQVVL